MKTHDFLLVCITLYISLGDVGGKKASTYAMVMYKLYIDFSSGVTNLGVMGVKIELYSENGLYV